MSQLNAIANAKALTIAPGATSWHSKAHLRRMRRALKLTKQTKRPSLQANTGGTSRCLV
ncbi:hypothetical protein ACQR16_22995 [Bradyrhizobium oligotrophicum]|uniref:hypothetical protein n=1 Tax=Bradyrhizobium oligotrophicum TaxID=44255 RepID=UPI003EBA0FF6